MKLNQYIDHTLLSPFSTSEQVETLCREAMEYDFYSVCVSPYHTAMARKFLGNSAVKIASVIGFPYGYNSMSSKAENMNSIVNLIDEYDVVVNLQAVVNKDWQTVQTEIMELTQFAHQHKKVIKWIVESGNISEEALGQLCTFCNEAQVDFMKTSTGMLGTGATLSAVTFMRAHLDDTIAIKASGGIRDRESAMTYINAGATRIGASKSVEIVQAMP